MVVFASPNALSAYHRMGLTAELEGQNLVAVTRPLISDPFEAQEMADHVRDSLVGGSSMRMEVDAGGAAVLLRTMPLVVHGEAVGAAMLIPTSPRSSGATVRCCPRTPPSARSTTG